MGRRSKSKAARESKEKKGLYVQTLDETPRHLQTLGEAEAAAAKRVIELHGEAGVLASIRKQKAEKRDESRDYVPPVDVHNIISQMKAERIRCQIENRSDTYDSLARYGSFLKSCHASLADEIPKTRNRIGLAKALADRKFSDPRKLEQRRIECQKANKQLEWLMEAGTLLNKFIAELKATPKYAQGMAELAARDIVQPCWESTVGAGFAAEEDDGKEAEEEDLSFEALLEKEKKEGQLQMGRGKPMKVFNMEKAEDDVSFEELLIQMKHEQPGNVD